MEVYQTKCGVGTGGKTPASAASCPSLAVFPARVSTSQPAQARGACQVPTTQEPFPGTFPSLAWAARAAGTRPRSWIVSRLVLSVSSRLVVVRSQPQPRTLHTLTLLYPSNFRHPRTPPIITSTMAAVAVNSHPDDITAASYVGFDCEHAQQRGTDARVEAKSDSNSATTPPTAASSPSFLAASSADMQPSRARSSTSSSSAASSSTLWLLVRTSELEVDCGEGPNSRARTLIFSTTCANTCRPDWSRQVDPR